MNVAGPDRNFFFPGGTRRLYIVAAAIGTNFVCIALDAHSVASDTAAPQIKAAAANTPKNFDCAIVVMVLFPWLIEIVVAAADDQDFLPRSRSTATHSIYSDTRATPRDWSRKFQPPRGRLHQHAVSSPIPGLCLRYSNAAVLTHCEWRDRLGRAKCPGISGQAQVAGRNAPVLAGMNREGGFSHQRAHHCGVDLGVVGDRRAGGRRFQRRGNPGSPRSIPLPDFERRSRGYLTGRKQSHRQGSAAVVPLPCAPNQSLHLI